VTPMNHFSLCRGSVCSSDCWGLTEQMALNQLTQCLRFPICLLWRIHPSQKLVDKGCFVELSSLKICFQ
jgi:hypothetical protein